MANQRLLRDTQKLGAPEPERWGEEEYMSLKYIGEGSPELLAWPETERRQIYLEALRRSYRKSGTWIGLILFLIVAGTSRTLALLVSNNLEGIPANVRTLQAIIGVLGWIILGTAQVWVIRKELRHMRDPQPAT